MMILVYGLVLTGAFFMLVAAIGLVRMPDLLMRMHAATKAGTLGAGLLLLAVAVAYGDGVTVRALAAIAFLFLTAPVAAHMIGRAAYYAGGVQCWDGTLLDELAEARQADADARAASSPS
ncbi:MAG: Na+/H+ antiporter subunit G [Bacteroidetes bacterium]|jgi:multicomponent Na+:H+ antiporter subunit G|nr:Na+/H+ antiporter subunit G [Bacteroidota bacterium]